MNIQVMYAEAIKAISAERVAHKTTAKELKKAKSTIKRMRTALQRIAAYSEGKEVTSSFDEPHSAKIARAALEDAP